MTKKLITALEKANLELVKQLVNDPATDVNYKGHNSQTPFHVACKKGRLEAVLILLTRKDLKVNEFDVYHYSPFFLCATLGWSNYWMEGIAKYLLTEHRVNINARDSYYRTAFWWVVQGRKPGLFKLMADDLRVDMNISDCNGWTPLMIATHYNVEANVQFMLSTGRVDLDKRTTRQWGEIGPNSTALSIAISNKCTKIERMIREAMQRKNHLLNENKNKHKHKHKNEKPSKTNDSKFGSPSSSRNIKSYPKSAHYTVLPYCPKGCEINRIFMTLCAEGCLEKVLEMHKFFKNKNSLK